MINGKKSCLDGSYHVISCDIARTNHGQYMNKNNSSSKIMANI